MEHSSNARLRSASALMGRSGRAVSRDKVPSSDQRKMSAAQRRKLLFDWNQTRREYPRDRCLHHLIEEQAGKTSEAIAVQDEDGSLTYRELNLRANRLAHRLRALGVVRETLVGICLEPSTNLLVALLAVMKAGGAYVPLDASYPKERLAFMVRDSGMPLVITQEKLQAVLPSDNFRILCLDAPHRSVDEIEANPRLDLTPENLAYVIYTSGSTGRPKGVMVTHRGLVNYLVWAAGAYEMEKGTGAPVHSSISFDLTVTAIFAPLLVGRSVKMLSQNLEMLGVTLRCETKFSLVKITPAHLELLCAQWTTECGAATRMFIVGGEALFGQSLDFWQRCAPESALVNEYGPTETVVGCCAYFVPRSHMFDGAIPIGRPIANTQVYVLDEFLEPVPVGETGELYIAGDGLARGYLNLPELTEEKFVANPFAAEDKNTSARMYKTGDLVRYLADGNLEFLGRADDQIKLRGYRIEPAEIETALLTLSTVRNAAVICLTSASGDDYLAAYFTANEVAPDGLELREHLKTRLPDYMIPAVFVVLPELPLTANGKVNRRALPPPELRNGASSKMASETERRVAELWSKALQRPVELDDNFFDLGGYSLLAVRLVAQMNDLFHTHLDALSFYQHPTVREMAQLLGQGVEPNRAKLVRVRPGLSAPVIFLNAPLEFVRMTKLMRDAHSFYISEIPFSEETIDAALRFETSAFPSLMELVAPHTALILSGDFREPIFLAGYSSYGTVAFEVAHQLQEAGKKIGGVFLFDANMKSSRWTELRIRVARHARKISRAGLPYAWKKICERHTKFKTRRQTLVTKADLDAPDAALSNGEISWRVFQRVWDHAQRHYRPRPLAAPGVLFRAEVTIYGDIHDHDGCLGWRGLFSEGFNIVEVPGDHVTMWRTPGVQTLSQVWGHSLGKLSCATTG